MNTRKDLLLLKFIVLNVVLLALAVTAYVKGLFDSTIAADKGTYICSAIFLLFLVALIECSRKMRFINRELNVLSNSIPPDSSLLNRHLCATQSKDSSARTLLADCLSKKLFSKIYFINNTLRDLVFLGFMGTITGFIISLTQIDPNSITDVSKVSSLVTALMHGFGVALYTTLVGGVCFLWLVLSYRMIYKSTVALYVEIVERGESLAQEVETKLKGGSQ